MEKEAAPLLEDCQISEATKIGFSKFYACEKDEKKFLVGITGIGKVFASSAVSALRLKYPTVDGLLNIGVGGSLDAEAAPLLQLIVGDKYVQHDLDTSAIGDPVGMVSGINKVYFEADKDLVALVKKASKAAKVKPCVGTIASGDRFIASKEESPAIWNPPRWPRSLMSISSHSAPRELSPILAKTQTNTPKTAGKLQNA